MLNSTLFQLREITFQGVDSLPWDKLVFVTNGTAVSWGSRRFGGGYYKLDGSPDQPTEGLSYPSSAPVAIDYDEITGWAPFTREQATPLGWKPNPYYSEG